MNLCTEIKSICWRDAYAMIILVAIIFITDSIWSLYKCASMDKWIKKKLIILCTYMYLTICECISTFMQILAIWPKIM